MEFWVTLRWAEAGAAALRGMGEKCSRCRETGVQVTLKYGAVQRDLFTCSQMLRQN